MVTTMTTTSREITWIAASQDGAISRGQLLALGVRPGFLSDRIRQGRWQRAYPGVAVVHTGPMGWRTRAWAGLLYCGHGAALSHWSAAFHWGISRPEPRDLEVSVPWRRHVVGQPGLRIYQRRVMPDNYGVIRAVHAPETVLDLWERMTEPDAALGLLADAARARVSLREVAQGAGRRARLPRRRLLEDLLADVREGIESPMERRYRRDVERRHGLPRAALQVRDVVGAMRIRADVVYPGLGVRVELDGQLGHPGGRTAADTWRDNAVVIERGDITLRYRWTHVAVTPCATAAQVGRALRVRGWRGDVMACGRSCGAPVAAG